MKKESIIINDLFNELILSDGIIFPNYKEILNAPRKQGVYLIINPNNIIVHVGNTPRGKNGIHQRLKNHLSGQSSFTKKYLHGKGSKLRGKYMFKYITVENPRRRVLLEAYAIGRLCPKHIGTG